MKWHMVDLGLRRHILPWRNEGLNFSLENVQIAFLPAEKAAEVTFSTGRNAAQTGGIFPAQSNAPGVAIHTGRTGRVREGITAC